MKRAITSAPVLAYLDPSSPFVLDTDASSVGIGAVLSQGGSPVAFYSHALNRAQANYCVTRKELLAMVSSVRHFHPYLHGQRFTVRTDHAALKWLFKDPEGQVARWLETLQGYDFVVEHWSGALHGNADAMSRCPCGVCKNCDTLDALELQSLLTNPIQPAVPQPMACAAAFNADNLRNLYPIYTREI